MTSLPLEGIRVLDLSRLLPGPFCSLLLADYGAEVVKVEDTGMGDYVRWSTPAVEGVEDSAKAVRFLALNRNKSSVRLNLKDPAGKEAFLRLVEGADVVLESFRPGVLDRLGVGYEVLRERNRGIDAAVCAERGITCCGTSSFGAPTVEITWGLILNLMRGLPQHAESMKQGRWQASLESGGVGRTVEGKTLGIIGLGKLGAKVAKVVAWRWPKAMRPA